MRQGGCVITGDRLGKDAENFAVRNAAIAARFADNDVKINFRFAVLAARTEQRRMAGRSIRTLVDSGHPPRHQLDLHPADGAVIGPKIAHLHTGQVLRLVHLHETVRFGRHQAE